MEVGHSRVEGAMSYELESGQVQPRELGRLLPPLLADPGRA